MKRKVLCVALSLTLCSSMVLQVGAAAVDSQSEAQMEDLTAEDEKEVPEETKDQETSEESEDIENGQENEPQEDQKEEESGLVSEEASEEETTEEQEPESEESSEAEESETTQIEAEGVVHTHLIATHGMIPADQVEWVQEENGEYRLYCHADGCDAVYFTANDGIIGIQNGENTSYYYFDQDGYMVTGEAKIQASETGLPKEDGTYYFLGAGEDNSTDVIEKSELMTLDAQVSPETSAVGSIQTDKWVWRNEKWNYYDETTGKRLTLDELKAQQKDPGNTIFKIGERYYALTDDCVPQTGRFAVANPYNGIESYFYGSEEETADGHKGYLMKGWVYLPTKVASGATASRYQYFGLSLDGEELKKQTDGQYYEGAEYMWNQTMYELRQIESCVNAPDRDMGDDPWYFLTANGYVEHDKLVVGTFNRPGKYYGVDNKGHLYRSTLGKVRNSSGKVRAYCFSASGVRCNYRNGWYMVPDTKDWYYFDNTYARYIKTGWQSIDLPSDPDRVCWAYYYKSGANKGKMKKNGWQGSRYIKPNGVMAMGVYKVGNTLYYFKPATKTKCYGTMVKDGWITSGSKKYYAYPSGKLYRGWHTIGGKIYYFIYDDGSMMKNQSRQYTGSNSKYKGKWGYVNTKFTVISV